MIDGNVYSKVMDWTANNFPYKSFYNSDDDVIYSFYRQG